MWVSVVKFIIPSLVVNRVILVVVDYFLSALLAAENQEQDDKAKQCSQCDTDLADTTSEPTKHITVWNTSQLMTIFIRQ